MSGTVHYPEPNVSKALFASKASAPFWAIVRIYLGWVLAHVTSWLRGYGAQLVPAVTLNRTG